MFLWALDVETEDSDDNVDTEMGKLKECNETTKRAKLSNPKCVLRLETNSAFDVGEGVQFCLCESCYEGEQNKQSCVACRA